MYKARRKKLLQALHKQYPSVEKGIIVLFATFEDPKYPFYQESSFYYLTGITEPGAVFCIYFDGKETLFLPAYGRNRKQWVIQESFEGNEFDIQPLGHPCTSYFMKPFFYVEEYENLIKLLGEYLGSQGMFFSLLDQSNDNYFFPIHRFEKLFACMNIIAEQIEDISPIVSTMRRRKDKNELSLMSAAIEITSKAHRHIAQIIKPGIYEYEIQAEIERVFTNNQAGIAFPSIVASGKNSTILHYMACDQKLEKGDLLVVDIGAQIGHYCADLTRTYAVSGWMTPRQIEVYKLVLELQEYIALEAKPGMFLFNPLESERSLHHLAEHYLKKIKYDQYFVHGIGHFLGLDVHDVGDMGVPLVVGDVFTIEPGIYIPQERLGVRIEDDFVVTAYGCRCLSDKLDK